MYDVQITNNNNVKDIYDICFNHSFYQYS